MTHSISRWSHPAIACAMAAVISGCGGGSSYGGGGSGYGGGASMPPPPPPTGTGTTVTANLSSIQDNVFTPICTVCHAGANAPRGLRLDAPNSYALLVGVDSSEVPSLKRVAPGNPDASYLIQKLRGTAAAGQRMPLGGPYFRIRPSTRSRNGS